MTIRFDSIVFNYFTLPHKLAIVDVMLILSPTFMLFTSTTDLNFCLASRSKQKNFRKRKILTPPVKCHLAYSADEDVNSWSSFDRIARYIS